MVLKYIGFKRRSGESTGSTFSALTVKREIQKKTAFDPGTPMLFESTQFQLDFTSTFNLKLVLQIMNLSKRRNKLYCVDSKEYYFIEIKVPYSREQKHVLLFRKSDFFLVF